MLKLMYITNSPDVAKIAENAGVQRIFIDMEYIGKSVRQGGMDTVQSHHTDEDIRAIKSVLDRAKIMPVRWLLTLSVSLVTTRT